MDKNRISEQQKKALLQLHFNELKHGLGATLSTSILRTRVANSMGRKLTQNHFHVGLKTLLNNQYVSFSTNVGKELSTSARESEFLWALETKGRMLAETLHSAKLRPIRSYTKSAVKTKK